MVIGGPSSSRSQQSAGRQSRRLDLCSKPLLLGPASGKRPETWLGKRKNGSACSSAAPRAGCAPPSRLRTPQMCPVQRGPRGLLCFGVSLRPPNSRATGRRRLRLDSASDTPPMASPERTHVVRAIRTASWPLCASCVWLPMRLARSR